MVCRKYLERALALVTSSKRRDPAMRFGLEPATATHCYLAAALFLQGFAEQSEALLERVNSESTTSLHVFDRAGVSLVACILRADGLGDRAALVEHVSDLNELLSKHRLVMHGGYADALLGCVAQRPADAIVAFERGFIKLAAVGTRNRVPFFMGRYATALACEGLHDQALSTIERALDLCEETAQRWPEAELWRVRADVLLSEPRFDREEAARCLERAQALAHARGARLYELRAASRLARLLADQGQIAGALALLAPVYGGFTEGFATADLVEARVLMRDLRGGEACEVTQDGRADRT